MVLIVVSDIFGWTSHLNEFAASFNLPYQILDPYQGQQHDFNNDHQAYQYFSENVGVKQYADHVYKELSAIKQSSVIIGFSAGAAAIWQHSDKYSVDNINQVYLFYGSQIRNMLDVQPAVPTNHILPAKESHFCINQVAEALKQKPMINIEQNQYLHGFMNPQSEHYNQQAYTYYLTKLTEQIS